MAISKNDGKAAGSQNRSRRVAEKSAQPAEVPRSSGQTAKKSLTMPSRSKNVPKPVASKRPLPKNEPETSAPKRRKGLFEMGDEEMSTEPVTRSFKASPKSRPRRGARKSAASELGSIPESEDEESDPQSTSKSGSLTSHTDHDDVDQHAAEALMNLKHGETSLAAAPVFGARATSPASPAPVSSMARRTRGSAGTQSPLVALNRTGQAVAQGKLAKLIEDEDQTFSQENAGKTGSAAAGTSARSEETPVESNNASPRKSIESPHKSRPSSQQQAPNPDERQLEIEQLSSALAPATTLESVMSRPAAWPSQANSRVTRSSQAKQTSTDGETGSCSSESVARHKPAESSHYNPPAPVANMIRASTAKSHPTRRSPGKETRQTRSSVAPQPTNPVRSNDSDADNDVEEKSSNGANHTEQRQQELSKHAPPSSRTQPSGKPVVQRSSELVDADDSYASDDDEEAERQSRLAEREAEREALARAQKEERDRRLAEQQALARAEAEERKRRWEEHQEQLQRDEHERISRHERQEAARIVATNKLYQSKKERHLEFVNRRYERWLAQVNPKRPKEWPVELDTILIQNLALSASVPIPERYSTCSDCEELQTIPVDEVRKRAMKLKMSMQQRLMDRNEAVPYWISSIR